ncbi:hypothetical protein A1O3_06056 [Capronia epimyces CBS 606.96]|uniref:Uncharacterized protein n=1 Tax=Capronia epimyces CBS 606.96 TaxID=1182542 RepID=W9XPT4_9EURO|nr:uncharacterized protein A1O3_06056 [Capronia epimyces CBS 606.96]EXJ82243.1 hypothetical protein A1O3_06056 [Capronia epimyces CBS 606.96]
MQPFSFGMRQSSAESVDDNRSRYVPSSVYSGPGPIDDSPAIGPPSSFMMGALRGSLEEQQTPRFAPLSRNPPRNSTVLNINDPVAMHLLTETAITDSREFEVLSFEEVEQLKREKNVLKNKIDTTRRKLALESKLRDAAQSLNRLYSTRDKAIAAGHSPKRSRRSFMGSQPSAGEDVVTRADDEYAASSRKVQEFTQELSELERRLDYTERRLLQHAAGILQMTHKGLKKNLRRTELPRSPESMASQPNDHNSGMGGIDDFDERSLYQVPDYVTNFGQIPSKMNKDRAGDSETKAIDNVARRLQELNERLHSMIAQADSHEHFDPPPQPTDEHMMGPISAQIQAYLVYLSQGLDVMEAAQARGHGSVQKSIFDSEEQLGDVNNRLQDMLEKTNSAGHSPLLQQDEPRGKDLQSQLAFSVTVLDRLNQRVDTLVEQKDILTRQIQQQRELNTKSDAERDTKIRELTDQLEEAKRIQAVGEEETQHAQNQIHLLVEQLDLAKQENVLFEQQRGVSDTKAVELERSARKEMEDKLMADLQAKQEELVLLQSELSQLRLDSESKTEQVLIELQEVRAAKERTEAELESHRTELAQVATKSAELETGRDENSNNLRRQINDLSAAKADAEAELSKVREEMKGLESEVVRAQTELTLVKAELDGAYGTRAQRAADVSMNPAIQKVIDDLNSRNKELESQLDFLQTQHETKGAGSAELQNKVNALQKELKDTIEDYEIMTKQSIDDEKERERLEESVDGLQQRCEMLESQLNEEKVKWLGAKAGLPNETTSTMVLKNEFKKMMRETRTENLRAIKAEQEERRRLEGIIKGLKKDLQQTRATKDTSTPQPGL